jgi:hypothetical protein
LSARTPVKKRAGGFFPTSSMAPVIVYRGWHLFGQPVAPMSDLSFPCGRTEPVALCFLGTAKEHSS